MSAKCFKKTKKGAEREILIQFSCIYVLFHILLQLMVSGAVGLTFLGRSVLMHAAEARYSKTGSATIPLQSMVGNPVLAQRKIM